MQQILVAYVFAVFLAIPTFAQAQSEPRYYGPILTWDGDPTTTMTVTWVESTGGAHKRSVAANDWRRGPSGFGYGDDDDATLFEDMKGNYSRVYIRREFELDTVDDEPAVLQIRYDDAFIAYLNGKEIVRKGIEDGRGPDAKGVGEHESDSKNFSNHTIDDWKQLAKKGKNVLAIEGHNKKKSSSDFTLDPYLDLNEDDDDNPIIDKGEKWDYLAGGDPPDEWIEPDFDIKRQRSGVWKQGKSGFGYGDDDDETELDMQNRYARLYIRKTFELEDVSEQAQLRIRYDDAFVAYLNGKEIKRDGVTGRGWNAKDVKPHDADKDSNKFDTLSIDNWSEIAVEGENVLAIEGHNKDLKSSDFTLDVYLEDGDETIIEKHETWEYLFGSDPPHDWTRIDFDTAPPEDGEDDAVDPVEDTKLPEHNFSKDRERRANRVFFRSVGDSDWLPVAGSRRSFGNTDDVVRTVQLTGLKPNTDYEFLLGGRTPRKTDIRRFRTAPDNDDEMTFVTGGDMSASETAQAMNRQVGKVDPVFALLGGDLAYANGKSVSLWHKWLDSWADNAVTEDGRIVPMVVAIGNHETGSKLSDKLAAQLGVPKNSQFFYSLFKLPGGRSNYAMDFGKYLSVFVLDSDHTQDIEDQVPWLDKSLGDHKNVPTRVVCYHAPGYGTAKDEKAANKGVVEHWVPLFEKHKVTVVFENDHHTLKRTHRLIDGKKNDGGILYLGDGSWGVKTRDIKDRDKRPYLAKAEGENHVWVVTIRDGQATYRAVDEEGKELDRYPE